MQRPTARRARRTSDNTLALTAALLLLAVVLSFLSSCGSEDLVFPGNAPPTGTAQNTPVNTATPDVNPGT
jgi:hypothetical protein